jgi:hypothetical protein
MPTEIEPPELARLVDFAERPRTQDWSLRAALVRYAQPAPLRVEALLEVIRRIEHAFGRNAKRFEREGDVLWRAVESEGGDDPLVELLRVAAEIDRLGDSLVGWAVTRGERRPDGEVERTTEDAARRLDKLGVPREERPRNRARA